MFRNLSIVPPHFVLPKPVADFARLRLDNLRRAVALISGVDERIEDRATRGDNECDRDRYPGDHGISASGFNDDHVLKLTPSGELVMQIGRAGESEGNADTENFHRVAAMQVHAPTNEVFVADGYGNHRVIVLDADTGAFKRMWGAFARAPVDEHRCGPSFVGPDAPSWNTDQFSIVHGIAVSNDGLVYVADRENGRVQVFTHGGEYVTQINLRPDANPMTIAFSPDDEQRYLYTWSLGQIHVHDRQSLELATAIDDDPSSEGPGHLMASDSQGNLYLARLAGGLEKLVLTAAAR